MFRLKNISAEIYLTAICILLCIVSIYSIAVSNYVLIYIVFIVSFIILVLGYFVLNKLSLYKMLFFFIPLSVPVGIIGEAQIQLPTEPLIGLLVLMVMAFVIRSKKELRVLLKNPIAIVLLIELVWMIVCSITSELQVVSFKYTLVRFCYISAFFVLGYLWLKQENKPHKFYLLYSLGMILPIINGLIFHSKLEFKQSTSYIMPQPFFNDHTVYGACIAFLIPALLVILFNGKDIIQNPIHRFLLVLLLLFFFIAEYFSFSRAAWLSLVCSLLLFVLIKLKISGKTFILLLLIITGLIFANMSSIQGQLVENNAISNKEDLEQQVKSITNVKTDISNKERINRWKCAIRMGQDKPFFGYGPRTYKFFYGTFQTREDITYTSTFNGTKGHSHSDYLAYFAEDGYLGFIIHILLYLVVIFQGLNTIQNCKSSRNRSIALMALLSLFTYIIHGLFNGFMDDEKMASLVYISMAMLVYVYEKEKAPITTNEIAETNELKAL